MPKLLVKLRWCHSKHRCQIRWIRTTAAEIGDRLATTDMNRKEGEAAVPLSGRGTTHSLGEREGKLRPHLKQCGLGWGLPPYQVVSWSIQLFGHNRHVLKIGKLCPFGGELGPSLTQCCLSRGLPNYQVAFSSIQPLGYNTSTLKTNRTDNGAINYQISTDIFANTSYYTGCCWHWS